MNTDTKGLDHMTKKGAMPMYSKILSKSSSEPIAMKFCT